MRLRKLLRKIHRWIGLLSALWLLQLAITGLLLQHADFLKLTETYVKSPTILRWFDYGHRQQAWDVGDEVIYQLDDVVKINQANVNMPSPLAGVGKADTGWILATANTLYWLNQQGEIINQMDDFDGLPTPIEQLDVSTDQVKILVKGRWGYITEDGVSWYMYPPVTKPVASRNLTAEEEGALFGQLLGNKLSYDKVIHAIHSGIKSSSWLNTFSALALLYLCFSGIYLFFKAPKNKLKK